MTDTTTCTAWHERVVRAMGSPGVVIAGDVDPSALDWAERELERLEQCWSRFRHDSELSELNRSAGRWHRVSPTLTAALDRACGLHALTGGRFDPTVHGCLIAAGYDRTFTEVPSDDPYPSPEPQPAPGLSGIRRAADSVFLPAGTSIDLGGVGKGLAADLVAEGLLARGARAVCVSLGGDIRVAGGSPSDGGWRIPVADPRSTGTLGTVAVHDAAIVTSTTAVRTWRRGGRRHHHLIDPATGASAAGGVRAVIATSREAWFAEGLAKAALVAGRVGGRRLLDRAGVGGWLVLDDGSVIASRWAPPLVPTPRASVALGCAS